jgi:hypothetical protein
MGAGSIPGGSAKSGATKAEGGVMFRVTELLMQADNATPREWATRYEERDEAVAAIENHIERFPEHGHDGEHDYWWGRASGEVRRFIIEGVPDAADWA